MRVWTKIPLFHNALGSARLCTSIPPSLSAGLGKMGLKPAPVPQEGLFFLCLFPQAGGSLAVRGGSGPFVAVDLGNCNLQDRFLPNYPRKNLWGIKSIPTQQPEAFTAPVQALPGVSSTRPAPGQENWGAQGTGELAQGQGWGQEAPQGGSCGGFSLHCSCRNV